MLTVFPGVKKYYSMVCEVHIYCNNKQHKKIRKVINISDLSKSLDVVQWINPKHTW